MEVNYGTAHVSFSPGLYFNKETQTKKMDVSTKMERNIHVPASVLEQQPAFHWQKGNVTDGTASPVVISISVLLREPNH